MTSRDSRENRGSLERPVPKVRKVMRDSRENRGPAELRVHRGCKESLERPAPKVRKVTSRDSRENRGSLERPVSKVRKVMRDSRENKGPVELWVHRGCKESPEKEKKASKAIPVRRVTRVTWVNRAIPGHRGPQSAVLYPRPIP